MFKHIFTILFLTAFFSSDVINNIVYDDCNLCLLDKPLDGEPENENQENAKDESKIENIRGYFSFLFEGMKSNNEFHINVMHSNSYLELITPPPEPA